MTDFTGLVSCGKLPVIMVKCGDHSSSPAARGASGWHFGHQKKWAAEFTAAAPVLPNSAGTAPRGRILRQLRALSSHVWRVFFGKIPRICRVVQVPGTLHRFLRLASAPSRLLDCLPIRTVPRAAESAGAASRLPNFAGDWHRPPAAECSARCLRWRFLQQLCAHKKVMENYFPGNFARLASTRVGWFLLKFPCRGTPRDPPPFPPALRAPPRGLAPGSAGGRFGHPRKWAAGIYCGLSRPAKFTSAASRAAGFSWNCLRCRTGLRSGHAYRSATARCP